MLRSSSNGFGRTCHVLFGSSHELFGAGHVVFQWLWQLSHDYDCFRWRLRQGYFRTIARMWLCSQESRMRLRCSSFWFVRGSEFMRMRCYGKLRMWFICGIGLWR